VPRTARHQTTVDHHLYACGNQRRLRLSVATLPREERGRRERRWAWPEPEAERWRPGEVGGGDAQQQRAEVKTTTGKEAWTTVVARERNRN